MRPRFRLLFARKSKTLHRIPTREQCNVDQAVRPIRLKSWHDARKRVGIGGWRLCRHCFAATMPTHITPIEDGVE